VTKPAKSRRLVPAPTPAEQASLEAWGADRTFFVNDGLMRADAFRRGYRQPTSLHEGYAQARQPWRRAS